MTNYIQRNEDIVTFFLELGDMIDKIGTIALQGEDLPPIRYYQRTEENKINNCLSTSYFICKIDDLGLIKIQGESQSRIIAGVIWYFKKILHRTPANEVDISKVDWYIRIGLSSSLTPARNDAIQQIVERITKAIEDYKNRI